MKFPAIRTYVCHACQTNGAFVEVLTDDGRMLIPEAPDLDINLNEAAARHLRICPAISGTAPER